jgi:hypothetical protein
VENKILNSVSLAIVLIINTVNINIPLKILRE